MTAEPTYFGGSRQLFGWYHRPAPDATPLDCAVVICAPLGYEGLCVPRGLRHWADALASAGIATLRFDYHGTGNSAGSDTDPERVAAWIDSIVAAAEKARSRTGTRRIVLAGVRLGGTLAMAAAQRAGADGLIVFASHATGRSYVRELRAFGRLMRATPMTDADAESSIEEVGGFIVTNATLASLTTLDPLAEPVGVRRALVIPRDGVATDMSIGDRLEAQGTLVERTVVPGYAEMMVDTHEAMPPRAVFDASTRWLTEQYGVSAFAPSEAREAASQATDGDTLIGEGIHERPATFGANTRLFGVLTEPAHRGDRVGTAIVLANAGSVHHIGPGRMYVSLAREWARMGFSVLRMDIGGVGDSDAHPATPDNHPYPDHAIDDLRQAVRWCRDQARCERVVIAGLCSGAHASFHAGLELENIAGIIAINPIVFYWNPGCALDVASWMNYAESRRYSQQARQVGSWMRLLRGEVRVRHAAAVGYRRAREVIGGAAGVLGRRIGLRGDQRENVAADLTRISNRGVTTLLAFSEGDPGLDVVRRQYSRDVRLLERNRRNFAMRVIPNADHTFTRAEARDRLRTLLTTHLMERYRV